MLFWTCYPSLLFSQQDCVDMRSKFCLERVLEAGVVKKNPQQNISFIPDFEKTKLGEGDNLDDRQQNL